MIKPFLKLGNQFGTDPNINPGNQNPQSSNFILLENGVTVRYIGSTAGEQGFLNGTLYTAVDNTMLNALDPLTDDYTTVCTTLCTDMTKIFVNATSFNQDISHWDVSNVMNMTAIFVNATSFNQDISHWDVSNVMNMRGMFFDATSFNQDISSWNVSNVTNMDSMFFDATSFNQDLSTWCVEQIPTEPLEFDNGTTSWILPKPSWGSICS